MSTDRYWRRRSIMLDVIDAQSSNQARRSVTFAVDPKSGSDSRSEG